MNWLLPGRGIEEVRWHRAFSILVTKFSKKPVLLPEHTIIAVETESLSAVVTPRKVDTSQAREDEENNEPEQRVSKIMNIKDWKRNWQTQMDGHVKM